MDSITATEQDTSSPAQPPETAAGVQQTSAALGVASLRVAAAPAVNTGPPGSTGASRERLLSSLAGSQKASASPDAAAPLQQNGGQAQQPGGNLGLLQQPLEEDPFFTVTDRRVRKEAEAASLYGMCRQWVQNDPESEAEPQPQHAPAVALPEPLPAGSTVSRPLPEEVPLFDDGTLFQDEETLPIELLLEHHKEHWQTVRHYNKLERERDLERFEHRLAALVPSIAPAARDNVGTTLAPMDIGE